MLDAQPASLKSNRMASTDRKLKRVAVFCGANAGARPEYLQSAKDIGEELVKRSIGLVYGGPHVSSLQVP